jgi:hypothetical protein
MSTRAVEPYGDKLCGGGGGSDGGGGDDKQYL